MVSQNTVDQAAEQFQHFYVMHLVSVEKAFTAQHKIQYLYESRNSS
jgi:hypothetical protein